MALSYNQFFQTILIECKCLLSYHSELYSLWLLSKSGSFIVTKIMNQNTLHAQKYYPFDIFFILPKTNSSTNKSDKCASTFYKSYKKLIYIIMICDLWYLNLHVIIWIVISINVLDYCSFLYNYVYIWHIFHLHYK